MNNYNLNKTITLDIDWQNIDSIKLAEKTKLKLENKNYKLINNFGGLRFTTMIYSKIKGVK